MASQSWGQMIATIPVAGTLYNTYTTAKSMLTSATATEASSGFVTLPPGFFQRGARLEIDVFAGLSSIVTTPGTVTIEFHVGNVIAFTTGAILMTTTGNVLLPLTGKIWLTCRAVGNGTLCQMMGQSTWWGQGIQQSGAAAANATNGATVQGPNTSPALGTGFDSTTAQTIDLWAGFSISQATNGFQLQQYRVTSWGNTTV
jgi:hypothetical protein